MERQTAHPTKLIPEKTVDHVEKPCEDAVALQLHLQVAEADSAWSEAFTSGDAERRRLPPPAPGLGAVCCGLVKR